MRAKSYLILLLFVFFTSTLFAQSNTITGKVLFIDKGVKGASIEISDINKKIYTDKSGNFTISVNSLPFKMKVKYKRVERYVNVNDKSSLKITLVPGEKKLYRLISDNPDLLKCEIFLREYPNGEYSSKVLELKEKLIFVDGYDFAVENFNIDKLEDYIIKYPEGQFLVKARKMIEITIWQLACKDNNIEAYKKYLNKYPNGIAARLAQEKIKELKDK